MNTTPTPEDGDKAVYFGLKGDFANGAPGEIIFMVRWEDGTVDEFASYYVREFNEHTKTWILQ